MFGDFAAHAGVVACNNLNFSPNLITPRLNWDFGDVFVLDFAPFAEGNLSDRPRINVWRDAGGEPDLNYLIYVSGGQNVISPAPTGKLIQPWGDRRTGEYFFPTTSITFLKQRFSGTNTNDNFGTSIDLNEDANILVIGSPNDDNSFGTNAGAAFVYVGGPGAGGGWDFKQKITGNRPNSSFGTSVAINNPGSVILVGSSGDDINGTDVGSVLAFVGNKNAGWTFRQQLTGFNSTDLFGSSLAIDDNGTVLVIGSPSNNENGLNVGGVFIYTGTRNNGWILKTKISGIGTTDSQFGYSLSANSNCSVILIGGPFYNNQGASNAGSILLYTGNQNDGWNFKQQIDGQSTEQRFGIDVDINNNGTVFAVGGNNGIVNIYSGNAIDGWQFETGIIGDNLSAFGNSVSIDKEGTALVVGAPFFIEDSIAGGAMFLFDKINDKWTYDSYVISDKNSDRLGWDVAINKNSNVLMTSAIGEDSASSINDIGSVLVFNRATATRKEIFAGIDVFTHSFARPVGINPPLKEWTIKNDVPGEVKYSYKFNLGEKTPAIFVKLDYKPTCKPVNIPNCLENQNLVYLGTDPFLGCPRFICEDPTSERGSLYTTSTWNSGPGVSNLGSWIFTSGTNTIRNISNSNQNGRTSIGDQAFFILGSSGILANHSGAFLLNTRLLSGDSLSIDTNYSWNKGFRDIRFITGRNLNDYVFRILHTNSDALIFERISTVLGGGMSTVILSNVFNRALRYKIDNLGTGLNFSAFLYNSQTPIVTQLYSNTVNAAGQNFNVITGISFSASLDNVPLSQWNNYGMYFNNISIIKNPVVHETCFNGWPFGTSYNTEVGTIFGNFSNAYRVAGAGGGANNLIFELINSDIAKYSFKGGSPASNTIQFIVGETVTISNVPSLGINGLYRVKSKTANIENPFDYVQLECIL